MTLPVLLYHHVGPRKSGTSPALTVLPEQFERQMRWLASRGYVVIRPSQWIAWCREGKALPDKPVLVTFDDGYADIAEYALPVLRYYGFTAGVYLVTGEIGGINSWDVEKGSGPHQLLKIEQIRKWADEGIEFGTHGRSHADLTMVGNQQLYDEVAGSARDLERVLGRRVSSFAYPYGRHNDEVRRCVGAEFSLAFSCEEGLNGLRTDPLLLRRSMVQPNDTLLDLECRLRFGFSPLQVAREAVRLRSRTRDIVGHLIERCASFVAH